jgi:hypothetical protein
LKSRQALALGPVAADGVGGAVEGLAEVRLAVPAGKPGAAEAGVAVAGAGEHARGPVLAGVVAQARVLRSGLKFDEKTSFSNMGP